MLNGVLYALKHHLVSRSCAPGPLQQWAALQGQGAASSSGMIQHPVVLSSPVCSGANS